MSVSSFAFDRFSHSIKHYVSQFCCILSKKNRYNAKPKTRMSDIRSFGFALLQFALRHQRTYVSHTLFTTIHKPGARKLQWTYVVLWTYVFSALQSEVSKFPKRKRIKVRPKLTYNSFVDPLMSHMHEKFIKFSFRRYNV